MLSRRILGWVVGSMLCFGCAHDKPAPTRTAAERPAKAERPAPAPEEPKVAEAPPPEPEEASPDAIFFDFDSALLRDDARDALAKVATELKEKNSAKIAIEGNCDVLGTVEYNLALGQHRAEAAKTYLMRMGVPRKRIQTASFGSQRTKYPGRDESAYAKNRRDDLIIR